MRGLEKGRQVTIDGLAVTVQRKPIKNMHLYVKAPDGRILVCAPLAARAADIERFVQKSGAWIRSKRALLTEKPRAPRRFVTGETLYFWGEAYRLETCAGARPDHRFEGGRLFLFLPPGTTTEARGRILREVSRAELIEKAKILVPKWERITGLRCAEWRTKAMQTRWGSCNTRKKRIWLSVQLAEKPVVCLEYVILHELVHLVEPHHNRRFYAIVERFMPDWPLVRARLNGQAAGEERNRI